ncbi:IclR family transcriptional regulator domain-containing protein [Methylobacterium platani]|uniref:IclR family transcriptional regulator domain-containing protein n=1 Tax=Methylobacterium platani TaxID=427683 RepID=UPI001428A544|nr:IclR family transcriptional regulator C-terminal domain-containing protein [Methylobacterium platani]
MHPPVRALTRGLSLLAELNAGGPSSAHDLARRTRLNRTTTYRLLETLKADGFVTYDENSGQFSPTPQVRQLSDGLTTRDASSQAALPPMFDLLREVNWPSDFGVFDAGSVMIRESTHPFSPFSVHRSMIGRRRSLLRTSLGRAILAAADTDLRRDMLEIAAASKNDDATLATDRTYIENIIRQTERDGYASSVGETETNISAIALPIRAQGKVVGSLNIIFFKTSINPQTAAERYVGALHAAVTKIEDRMDLNINVTSAD